MSKDNYNDDEATEEEDIYGEGMVRPMMHTTVNKLIKLGKLKQDDMIGGKLTSEKARKLYKNNIRVHIRHYVPKDQRKYFHDVEIKGGMLDIGNAVKKIGSTVKHTFNKAVEKVGQYTDVVLHGRNDYPPKVRNLIKIYGDKRITHITVDRTPVPSVLTSALNAVSLGAFKQRFDKLPYDKLFHLRMDLTFSDNTRLAVEKNEVINMYTNPKKLKEGEQRDVICRESDLTLNKLLAGGQNIQKDKWFGYSASNNNCQDFILSLLNGSHIGNDQDRQFVKQDTSSLFQGDSFLRKFANTVTDIGSKVNEITTGAGLEGHSHVQSVLFDKSKWTVYTATKWLKKHGYDGLGVDEKPNTLRFRQVEPNKSDKYITKTLPDNIELVIAYKNKVSNNKHMVNKITGRGGGASTARVTPELLSDEELLQRRNEEDRRLLDEHTRELEVMMKSLADRYSVIPHNMIRDVRNLATITYRNRMRNIRRTRAREDRNRERIRRNMTPPVSEDEDEEGSRTESRSPEHIGRGVFNRRSDYESSSSDSSSDDESQSYKGRGLQHEKDIIQHIKKLGQVIKAHQQVHGGSLSILDECKKMIPHGDLVHIDIGSHNAKGNIEGEGIRGGNLSLLQLMENFKKREDADLKKSMKQYYKDRNEEVSDLTKNLVVS